MNINCIHPRVIIGGVSNGFSKIGSFLGKACSVIPGKTEISSVASKVLSTAFCPATKTQKITRSLVLLALGAVTLKKVYDFMKNYYAIPSETPSSEACEGIPEGSDTKQSD